MPKAKAVIIPVTPFQQNCTLLWCEATERAALIDPGGDLDRVREAISETGVTVERIWLTHGHIDHAGGATEMKEALGVSIEGPHRAEASILANLSETGLRHGIPARAVAPDRWLDDGDRTSIGELAFDIFHCPGHSPGSIVFVETGRQFAIVGDVLFRGSVGRTDLAGGDHAALIRAIEQKLLPLGDNIPFICGHGPGSTFGHERATNPFLQ